MTRIINKIKTYEIASSIASCGPNSTNLRISNTGKKVLKLKLDLVGGKGYFSVPKNYRSIALKPKEGLDVPIKLVEGNPFRIMDANVKHKAYLRVKGEQGRGQILSAPVKAYAPLYAPSRPTRCMHYSPKKSPHLAHKLHHSPPDIARTVFRTGTPNVANVGEVDHFYYVNIETESDVLQIEEHWPILWIMGSPISRRLLIGGIQR